ncbi:MAG: nitrous oxide reductase accessory protein NosL [Magnetococcus sp. DMHC-1]
MNRIHHDTLSQRHWLLFCFTLPLLLLLAACGSPPDKPPAARNPDSDTVGYYCGMNLAEHVGPKSQIHVAGEAGPLWFSSVQDAFVYQQTEGATRRLLAFYVNDMSHADWQHPQPGPWIAAQSAWFVVGSRLSGGMGKTEIMPFGDQAAAEKFVQQFGGRVVPFIKVTQENMYLPGEEQSAK